MIKVDKGNVKFEGTVNVLLAELACIMYAFLESNATINEEDIVSAVALAFTDYEATCKSENPSDEEFERDVDKFIARMLERDK